VVDGKVVDDGHFLVGPAQHLHLVFILILLSLIDGPAIVMQPQLCQIMERIDLDGPLMAARSAANLALLSNPTS
jgi:hypothetical protein